MEENEWADAWLYLEHNPSSLYGRTRALRGIRSARMNKAVQGSEEMGEEREAVEAPLTTMVHLLTFIWPSLCIWWARGTGPAGNPGMW